MATTAHASQAGLEVHNPFQYAQSSDPGAVGAGLYWLNTTPGSLVVKRRNSTNTSWDTVGAGATGATGTTGATGDTGATGANGISTTIMAVTGVAPYVNVQDIKASGTNSGTFTSGAWRTRDLTQFTNNDMNLASLASNRITLPAGTWRVSISCPAQSVSAHKARLQNITESATLLWGTSEYSFVSGAGVNNRSFITGRVGLQVPTVIEVQHWGNTTAASRGFGELFNVAGVPEVYTMAEFWLEGSPPALRGSTQFTENPSFDKITRQRRAAY